MGVKTLFGFASAILISTPLTLSVLSRHEHTGEGGRDLLFNTAAAWIDNPGKVLERVGYDFVPFVMPPEHTYKIGSTRIPNPGYSWTDPTQKKVQWSPGIKHPDIKNIHAGAEAGKWNPNIGYVIPDPQTLEAKWQQGLRYEKLPHMQSSAEEGKFKSDPGYAFPNAEKLEAVWEPGRRHDNHPQVLAGAREGQWSEAPGYKFREKGRLEVEWVPGWQSAAIPHMRASGKENVWHMDPGYKLSVSGKGDLSAVWIPETPDPNRAHIVAGPDEGKWLPADGYDWAGPNDNTVVWKANRPSRLRPHMLTHSEEGSWTAEEGYRLQREGDGKWAAVKIPDPVIAGQSSSVDDCIEGAKTGVKIAVVGAAVGCTFDVLTLGLVTGGTLCGGTITLAKVASAGAAVAAAGCATGVVLGSSPKPETPNNPAYYNQQRIFTQPGPR